MLSTRAIGACAVLLVVGCATDGSDVSGTAGPGGKGDNPTAVEDMRCRYGEVAYPLDHEDLREEGYFNVAKRTVTFVDPTRPTMENGWYWGSDERKLKTAIYYPAEGGFHLFGDPDVDRSEGPYPLVIYSHGFSSSAEEAKTVAEHLASHGYIVAAPTFPLSNMLAPGGATFFDLPNQPGDVSFLIDQLLAKSALADDDFFGAVDGDRIGLIGLSLGGFTTFLSAFHPTMGDPRVKAAVTLAGPASLFGENFYRFRPTPLLVVHGDIDAFIDYEHNARRAFDRAQPNANLLTVVNGSHTGFGSMGPRFIMEILGDVVAPEGAHPDNPDRLGCGVVGENIQDQAMSSPSGDFVTALGGPEEGIVVPEDPEAEPLPCENDYITRPAISTDAQLDITKRASLAFFAAHLGAEWAREDNCHYLNEVLAEDPDVVFE